MTASQFLALALLRCFDYEAEWEGERLRVGPTTFSFDDPAAVSGAKADHPTKEAAFGFALLLFVGHFDGAGDGWNDSVRAYNMFVEMAKTNPSTIWKPGADIPSGAEVLLVAQAIEREIEDVGQEQAKADASGGANWWIEDVDSEGIVFGDFPDEDAGEEWIGDLRTTHYGPFESHRDAARAYGPIMQAQARASGDDDEATHWKIVYDPHVSREVLRTVSGLLGEPQR